MMLKQAENTMKRKENAGGIIFEVDIQKRKIGILAEIGTECAILTHKSCNRNKKR